MSDLNQRMFHVRGTLVRNTNGNLVLTLQMQMNQAVAASFLAITGTPATVVCTSPGGGNMKMVVTVTPDTPIAEVAQQTAMIRQVPEGAG